MPAYKNYKAHKKMQRSAYGGISVMTASKVLLTAGIVAAEVVVGITIAVAASYRKTGFLASGVRKVAMDLF